MKTAQDSYTITIKQIVRFQERMHLEKFQVDKIKNDRLSAIIHPDRPDIAEYHENRSGPPIKIANTWRKIISTEGIHLQGQNNLLCAYYLS